MALFYREKMCRIEPTFVSGTIAHPGIFFTDPAVIFSNGVTVLIFPNGISRDPKRNFLGQMQEAFQQMMECGEGRVHRLDRSVTLLRSAPEETVHVIAQETGAVLHLVIAIDSLYDFLALGKRP